ncbi:hypothetical protein JCM19992_32550 [Thermostilla marina]
MQLSRHHYFVAGVLLLFFGLEVKFLDSVVLTPEATKILAEKTGHPVAATSEAVSAATGSPLPTPPFKFQPPDWLAHCALSVASVLLLYSWLLPRTG